MQRGKGVLAADESDRTAGLRLKIAALPNEPEHRRDFRELLFTAPGIEAYLSGVILYHSSIQNTTREGVPFADVLAARGIIPGIKVDTGTRPLEGFDGEVVTQGLDDLSKRLVRYRTLGARFTKWRAVIAIGDGLPTPQCLEANAMMLARFAALSQEAGLVPVVEPEVLFAGSHSRARAEEVTTHTLQVVCAALMRFRVSLPGLIIKTSMVLAGEAHPEPSSPQEVANATLRTFHLSVPHEVGGIVFLSGGQTPQRATENLNAIAQAGGQPWPLTFSFSRSIEEPVLAAWQGKGEQVKAAQEVLLEMVRANARAGEGKYEKGQGAPA